MTRHPAGTVGATGAVVAFATVAYMVAGGSDVAGGYILIGGVLVGLAVALVTALVLWLLEIVRNQA